MIKRFFKEKPERLSKVEYWKKWEFFELVEDLHKAEKLLAEFKGGYSNQFDSAQDFHSHLVDFINDIEYGNRIDISELWIWFAPTCAWDDLVGLVGIEIGNRIFERVDNWKNHNST
ncbi:hypothetical protein ES731_15355 [Psychroflexus gondwanensis]|jgi:hypothetical protein|uniref:hypothetical protein n=1 Tax=Psychroflexus gondwanensis TaxID=251 RepID=UPI0011BDCBF0|nr:hypothetical protein [Psychroflexus gondwanensis]TXE15456.1 hypothetical protein ES731_15355 [Psychroflexus gondwanensis]